MEMPGAFRFTTAPLFSPSFCRNRSLPPLPSRLSDAHLPSSQTDASATTGTLQQMQQTPSPSQAPTINVSSAALSSSFEPASPLPSGASGYTGPVAQSPAASMQLQGAYQPPSTPPHDEADRQHLHLPEGSGFTSRAGASPQSPGALQQSWHSPAFDVSNVSSMTVQGDATRGNDVLQRTLALFRPGAVESGLAHKLLSCAVEAGLRVSLRKTLVLSVKVSAARGHGTGNMWRDSLGWDGHR